MVANGGRQHGCHNVKMLADSDTDEKFVRGFKHITATYFYNQLMVSQSAFKTQHVSSLIAAW